MTEGARGGGYGLLWWCPGTEAPSLFKYLQVFGNAVEDSPVAQEEYSEPPERNSGSAKSEHLCQQIEFARVEYRLHHAQSHD